MTTDYDLLRYIESRQRPVGWYALRNTDVSPYPDPLAALRALAGKHLLVEVPGDKGPLYQLTPAGLAILQQRRAQLAQKLADLRAGRLSEGDADNALIEFGKERYTDARDQVDRLLASTSPRLRASALEVLVRDWHLTDTAYWETAKRFLSQDSDATCREVGATTLARLCTLRVTQDPESLRLLAWVVRDETAPDSVRLAAYRAMKSILRADIQQLTRLSQARNLAAVTDLDWGMVDQYAAQAAH